MRNVNKPVSNEDFVKAWIHAFKHQTGLRELANKLGMEYPSVSGRATQLRKAGVRLPTMPKKNQKTNVLTVDPKPLNDLLVKELGEESLGWRNR
jgi:hypothetical protein